MTTLGFYFPSMTNEEANALRASLNDIAAEFGYTSRGKGNLVTMLLAIDAGELALVLLPDEQFRPALETLDRISSEIGYDDNWAASIAASLRDALQRSIEAEQAEIDDYK